jgi:SAM-dependent methyltransferase
MSALGQKQTFAAQNGMSALPQKADIERLGRNVRQVRRFAGTEWFFRQFLWRMCDQTTTTERPFPPKHLRVRVGPFSDAGLFQRSGDQMAAEIIDLCEIRPDASVLEVGCGCGRLSRAFGEYLNPLGSYDGLDVSADMIAWCQRHLRLPNSRFTWVDVHSPDQNPGGSIKGAALSFPYEDCKFDAAIVSSVFTHMMPDEIERYVSEIVRVLKPAGCCFVTAFLID